jgi:RNA polymerase-binding transcription factor DksA
MAVKKATSATERGVLAKKASSRKASPAKVTMTKTTTKKTATKKTTTTTEPTNPSLAAKTGARPQRLQVREDEKPWTVKELATVRAELEADVVRLQSEISVAEIDLAGLMRDVGDGAGDDPADAGTATFEREQEISLANNAREVFEQSARALARLVDGIYGICESCGNPIGKNRLLAFPRATLCLTCKAKQERR